MATTTSRPPSAPDGFRPLLVYVEEVAREAERVRLGAILEGLGRDGFGSVMLVAGLTTLAPLVGDIPGVPTTMGLLVVLTAVQALVGREGLWLPGWLARRSVGAKGVRRAVRWLRPAARVVDRVVTRRLEVLVGTGGDRALAVLCLLVGAAMPLMELVPFSANLGGLALTLVGLAWIARDGAIAALLLLAAAAGGGLLVAGLA